MAGRSLKLSSVGKNQVERALTDKKWSTEDLAAAIGVQRAMATNFRAGKAVDRKNFVKFCEVLGLSWESVCEETIAPVETPINLDRPSTPSQPDDALFQQVREHCRQKILNQHSRMRLLSGEEIGVDQLYVDVYLLNRSPCTFQVSPNKLLETFDLRNDRLGLGDRIRRNPGFDVANKNEKLLILGKPGSGKTTFLKQLAVDWCNGKFQPNSIVILIELRRIRDDKWNLIEAIDQELGLGNWNQFIILQKQIEDLEKPTDLWKQAKNFIQDKTSKEQRENRIRELKQQLKALPLQNFLKQGKLSVLMDGLDELPMSGLRSNVQKQLQQLAVDYPRNQLILTCRTQIIEAIPLGFISVEVADFSEEKVKQFVQKWFTASSHSSKEILRQREMFDHAVNLDPALKELTVTPVLLSLTCLVLQDEGDIPTQKHWLYQKGIKLLLSKWNDAKQIDEWEMGNEIYRQLNLNVEQKEALLSNIAVCKFESSGNFVLFQQRELVNQITEFLQLANSREGTAVLKAIEAQHGLLVERADELWSFSHLTFQEYFAFQWITQLPPEQLVGKLASQQWQEVVKQIVRSQQPADRLVQMIKQAIDQSIVSESILQNFLLWILRKTEVIQVNYKPAAVRAFYSSCIHARNFACILTDVPTLTNIRSLSFNDARMHDLVRIRALELGYTLTNRQALPLNLSLSLDLSLSNTFSHALSRTLDESLTRTLNLDLTHTLNCAYALNSKLTDKLEQLRRILPSLSTEIYQFQQWWQLNGEQWTDQLRQVMIEHCNIGHDWQFTKAEIQQLQRYYDANRFLVELMQIRGAVSKKVREEIEDSLLLPWEELQQRQG